MFERKQFFVALIWVGLATTANAFGNDNEWVSGFGQGICESTILRGAGNSIYVTCDCGAAQDSTKISFSLIGENPTGTSILLTFDGDPPRSFSLWDGSITSNCRACAATFETAISEMKSHRSVNVRFETGESATFSLQGSSKAIGECLPDFHR